MLALVKKTKYFHPKNSFATGSVAGIPNTLRTTTKRRGNWSLRTFHQLNKSNESKYFFEIKGVDMQVQSNFLF